MKLLGEETVPLAGSTVNHSNAWSLQNLKGGHLTRISYRRSMALEVIPGFWYGAGDMVNCTIQKKEL